MEPPSRKQLGGSSRALRLLVATACSLSAINSHRRLLFKRNDTHARVSHAAEERSEGVEGSRTVAGRELAPRVWGAAWKDAAYLVPGSRWSK